MSTKSEAGDALGVVLVGTSAGSATFERFIDRGYDVLVADAGEWPDVEDGLRAVRRGMDALAAQVPGRKIAVVGFGRGGRFAYLALTRLGADAAAAFHGADIGRHLDEAARATKPLSLHFGDDDEDVPLAEVRAIKGALEGFATTEIYRYPGVGAGFALRGDRGYNETAALQAERRVFALLDQLG